MYTCYNSLPYPGILKRWGMSDDRVRKSSCFVPHQARCENYIGLRCCCPVFVQRPWCFLQAMSLTMGRVSLWSRVNWVYLYFLSCHVYGSTLWMCTRESVHNEYRAEATCSTGLSPPVPHLLLFLFHNLLIVSHYTRGAPTPLGRMEWYQWGLLVRWV